MGMTGKNQIVVKKFSIKSVLLSSSQFFNSILFLYSGMESSDDWCKPFTLVYITVIAPSVVSPIIETGKVESVKTPCTLSLLPAPGVSVM